MVESQGVDYSGVDGLNSRAIGPDWILLRITIGRRLDSGLTSHQKGWIVCLRSMQHLNLMVFMISYSI